MQIRAGFELTYRCAQPTPMILTLNVHYSRVSDLLQPDHLRFSPSVPVTGYRDSFGNWCTRIVAPAGALAISADCVIHDHGAPDAVAPWLAETPVPLLPEETLQFLLPSRYCESDLLSETAWALFSSTPPGWPRVQAICDFVHGHIDFGYEHASPTKTAFLAHRDRTGVCRDFAHLAIAFCRAMNIPARYCTGYLGDIGVAPNDAPMDFAGWFEAYLGQSWYTFDPRNHAPRIGRILVARGRDAADVALSTSFGTSVLESFRVWTDQVA